MKKRLEEERLLTAKEVCELVAISVSGLRLMVRSGRFPPPLVLAPRIHRWRPSDVSQALAKRVKKA